MSTIATTIKWARINWTEEQEKFIRENHNKITLVQIHERFFANSGISYGTLKRKTQRMGLTRDKTILGLPSKNTYDYQYWAVPNLMNSYFAGYTAADGCILLKKNTYSYQLQLSVIDEITIDNLIKEIKFIGEKRYITQAPRPDGYKSSRLVRLRLGCFNQNAEYLKNYFNIIPDKTKRLQPTNLVNKYLIESYIIGLLDGDGSIEVGKGHNDKPYPRISFTSSSLDIVVWLKDYLDKLFETSRPAYSKVSDYEEYYRFYICGFRAGQLIDYLRQFPIPKLARKWDQPEILDFIDNAKRENPEAFKTLDIAEMNASIQRDYPQPAIIDNNNNKIYAPQT